MCKEYNDLFETIGKIFLHVIPYEDGVKVLSPTSLLPKIFNVWYSDSILAPISPYVPKPNPKWVRM